MSGWAAQCRADDASAIAQKFERPFSAVEHVMPDLALGCWCYRLERGLGMISQNRGKGLDPKEGEAFLEKSQITMDFPLIHAPRRQNSGRAVAI